MIGFWLVNLFPPGAPQTFDVNTPTGRWTFQQSALFGRFEPTIRRDGACGNTYSIEFVPPGGSLGSDIKEAAILEALPICLGASFVTGAAVTIRDSLDSSEVKFVQVGNHFPRARGIPDPMACVDTLKQFTSFLEQFVASYGALNPTEKLLLLVHFYIDALSCWSLENLYLSGSTLLQLIASTEEDTKRPYAAAHMASRTGNPQATPAFFDYLAGAADRVGIAPLGHDVVKIRNSLIHEGTLQQPNFPTQAHAAKPIADALGWVDEYVYAVLGLGPVPKPRHQTSTLTYRINSFSF